VIGTPVHFGGMTVRGRAVILKFNFSKKGFLLGHSVRNSNIHPVYVTQVIHQNIKILDKKLHISLVRACIQMAT
jgi:hypothetical protein